MKETLLERSETCTHSQKERTLTGTWTTLELQKAIQKGYVIITKYGTSINVQTNSFNPT